MLLFCLALALASCSTQSARHVGRDCPVGASATIQGQVLAADGAAVGGALIELDPGSDYTILWETDQTGEFRFDCIPSGTYTIRMTAKGFEGSIQRVSVREGMAVTKVLVTARLETKGD